MGGSSGMKATHMRDYGNKTECELVFNGGGDQINADGGAGNNRFRSINRSFRTAVDKSFDMPSSSGKF